MNVLIAFLCMMFILSGSRSLGPLLQRPIVLLGVSIVVAASYFSLRVVQ